MDLVRQDAKTRVILACRPQGKELILGLLLRIGIDPSTLEPMAIPAFKKSAAAELAKEVLGPALDQHLDEFIQLTDKNPFLITTAGALLREGRLQWGTWRTQPEFRQRVFQEFEEENLNLAAVPPTERPHARLLLRMLAVLSPVPLTPELIEKAGRLIPGGPTLEPLFNFLRLAELVVGPDQRLRVAPDLFADFLVYEACFEPSKKVPVWVKKLLGEFREHGVVLIRNISEASWIAELNGVNDGSILAPLTDWQREEFLKQSFFGRQMILDKWKAFSHYLPEQTLELAKLAIREKKAPPDPSPVANSSDLNSYERLLVYVPALLRPVAKYHLKFSHEALDILWALGRDISPPQHNNQNHPWTVAAEVFKYADRKPKAYYESALDWFELLLKRPDTRKEFLKPNSVLSLFLGPCFARTFDASYSEGRQIHIIEKHVSAERSEELRLRARKILEELIDAGPAILALDALTAVEVAIRRAGTPSDRGILNPDRYRKEWRPDRLKALALYQKVLRLYPGVEVRYTIRRELRRLVIYEEDSVFARKVRKVLDSIADDLALRTAIALTSDFSSEFEYVAKQKDDPKRFDRMRDEWAEIVSGTAREIAKSYPTAGKLHGFMLSILEELLGAGHGQNINLYQLFASLGFLNRRLASALAEKILTAKANPYLLHQWTALIDNTKVSDRTKFKLFQRAVRANVEGAGVAVIRHVSTGTRGTKLLDQSSRDLLFQIAQKATPAEAATLMRVVTDASEINLPWCFQLLKILTRKQLEPGLLGVCLSALAPFTSRKTNPPKALVRHVFERFVPVPDLGFFEHGHEWAALGQLYPMEIYELLRERIRYAGKADDNYTAIPHDLDGHVTLPGMATQKGIGKIVGELWAKATNPKREDAWSWTKLFHAVALTDERFWKVRLIKALNAAQSVEDLARFRQLISFEGSLIIFGFPKITELFLKKANELGGKKGMEEIRTELWAGAGPRARGFTNGKLDEEYDYLEAAAAKAAEENAANPLLGPFYNWIVKQEQTDKVNNIMRAQEE